MEKNEKIIIFLKEKIKEKRYYHILRVAETAVKFAKIHDVSVEDAYIAALLHDCAKGNEDYYLEKYSSLISVRWKDLEEDLKEEKLIHAPLAALIAEEEFGIEDKEILDAITYHTTGKMNMTKLEMVVFLADKLEPERNYEGIDRIRELALEDLEKAMILSFDNTIQYLIEKDEPIALLTIEIRNELLRR